MSKMTSKITIEKSKGQHIETPITSERNEILTFRKNGKNCTLLYDHVNTTMMESFK